MRAAAGVGIVGLVAWSAVLVKTSGLRPRALLEVREVPAPALMIDANQTFATQKNGAVEARPDPVVSIEPVALPVSEVSTEAAAFALDPTVRWFNGRPVRPARTIQMVVTAYSPDERSCGDSADGITATLHSVSTNGTRLVASDPRLLPYGSLVTVPGYDDNLIVPVLDTGGAIRGRRLDVLYATHEEALRWGIKNLAVTVWEYADGLPPDNPRKLR